MIEIQQFIDHVGARVPQADDLSIDYSVRQAIIDVMKETRLFFERTKFYGQRGVSEYILEIPDDHVVIDVLNDGVMLNGRPYSGWRRDANYDVIILTNTPVDGGCYTVEYCYHINADCGMIPRILYDKYLAVIVNRTIMMLYDGTKDSPVSQHLFQIAERDYKREIEELTDRRLHNFANKRPSMFNPKRHRGGYNAW